MFLYKFINNLLPHTFSSYFTSVRSIHTYPTRSRNNLFLHVHVPVTRTSYSLNTLRFDGPRLWNSMDEAVKTQPSVGRFKSSYKTILISQYLTYIQCSSFSTCVHVVTISPVCCLNVLCASSNIFSIM